MHLVLCFDKHFDVHFGRAQCGTQCTTQHKPLGTLCSMPYAQYFTYITSFTAFTILAAFGMYSSTRVGA